jgi:hypothetical protein
VSGAASIIHARLLEDPAPSLLDLSGSLMAVLVLPFVGEGVARSELARSTASASRGPGSARHRQRVSPVSARRVSDRTARVVTVIASSPGISNRLLAREAGNIDEGQISRLLARLSGLGLIANEGPDTQRGGCNAWHLTLAGSDFLAGLPDGRKAAARLP